jgi:hypothetical protein
MWAMIHRTACFSCEGQKLKSGLMVHFGLMLRGDVRRIWAMSSPVHFHMFAVVLHSVMRCSIVSVLLHMLQRGSSLSFILYRRSFVGSISWITWYHAVFILLGIQAALKFFQCPTVFQGTVSLSSCPGRASPFFRSRDHSTSSTVP